MELVPQALIDLVARGQQLGEHEGILESLGCALGDRGRAAVRGIADDHDASAVPGRRHQMLGEPRVVRVGTLLEIRADRVPRPAVRP